MDPRSDVSAELSYGSDAPASSVGRARAVGVLRDLVALGKPRVTVMVVVTALGGLFLAGRGGYPAEPLGPVATAAFLTGMALIVSGANALNMLLERDLDGRMDRTRRRPLPAGRLTPRTALVFGVATSAASVPLLAFSSNALTAFLAVLANLLYVFAYTPLKQRSHYALQVGAVPGAIPPLLGWTAATNRVDAAGLALFAILFLWQIPHFHAIALFRREDYARAGLVVLPNAEGEEATRHSIVRWLFPAVASTFLVVPLGLAHGTYLALAALVGVLYFGLGCYGLAAHAGRRWARGFFGASILYLCAIFALLALDPGA